MISAVAPRPYSRRFLDFLTRASLPPEAGAEGGDDSGSGGHMGGGPSMDAPPAVVITEESISQAV